MAGLGSGGNGGGRPVDAGPRPWLVGYGEWTGYASATLIGVGGSARATVEEIADALREDDVQPAAHAGRRPAR